MSGSIIWASTKIGGGFVIWFVWMVVLLTGSASISSVSELKELLNGSSCSHRCFSVTGFPMALVSVVVLRFLLAFTGFQLSSW